MSNRIDPASGARKPARRHALAASGFMLSALAVAFSLAWTTPASTSTESTARS